MIQYYVSKSGGWFRAFGWGLVISGGRMYFSERSGYGPKPLLKMGRWRVRVLKPNDWRA